jgi:hypothetical protein
MVVRFLIFVGYRHFFFEKSKARLFLKAKGLGTTLGETQFTREEQEHT